MLHLDWGTCPKDKMIFTESCFKAWHVSHVGRAVMLSWRHHFISYLKWPIWGFSNDIKHFFMEMCYSSNWESWWTPVDQVIFFCICIRYRHIKLHWSLPTAAFLTARSHSCLYCLGFFNNQFGSSSYCGREDTFTEFCPHA